MVEAALTAALLYLLINLVVSVTMSLQWAAVLPLVLLVVGSVGYSLILGGLTLLFKRLEILKDLFQTAVLIFGGVLVSLERMPGWMATIAVPPTHAGGGFPAQDPTRRGVIGDAGRRRHAPVDGRQRGGLPGAGDRDLSLVRTYREATRHAWSVLMVILAICLLFAHLWGTRTRKEFF